MSAIAASTDLSRLPVVASWLRHCDAAKALNDLRVHDCPESKLDSTIQNNVVAQLANLRTHPSVAVGLATKSLNLHGWVFNIESGMMLTYDGVRERFTTLIERPYRQ